MEWKRIRSGVCCNRQRKPLPHERLYRPDEPVPKKFRCSFNAKWSGVDTGRELVLRCDFHHKIELLEEQALQKVMTEICDAKMFILPYIELQTPVSP
jgi:hypothetical protein